MAREAAATKATKVNKDLVRLMDAEAKEILSLVKSPDVSLETRLVGFERVSRWCLVRNRLGEAESEEGILDAYRRRITAAQSEAAQREAERIKIAANPGRYLDKPRTSIGRVERTIPVPVGPELENGGPELEALKSRLPPADDGNADGNRGRAGEQIAVDAGPVRLIRTELPGNTDTIFDESHGGDEF